MSTGGSRTTSPPDGSGESTWGKRIAYDGSRGLLAVALALWATLLFPAGSGPPAGLDFAAWEVAPQDVAAQVDFSVPKSVAELEAERLQAMATVAPTFDLVPSAVDSTLAQVQAAFSLIDSLARFAGAEEIAELLSGWGIAVTEELSGALDVTETRGTLGHAAHRAVTEVLDPERLMEAAHLESIAAEHIVIRDDAGREIDRPTAELIAAPEFLEQATTQTLPVGTSAELAEFFQRILERNLNYPLRLNATATDRDRSEAADAVAPVSEQFVADQAIVRAGDRVGEEARRRLQAHEDAVRALGGAVSGGGFRGSAGLFVVHSVLLAVFGVFLVASHREIYHNFRWLLLLAVLSIAYFSAAFLINRAGAGGEWLPIVFVIFPAAVLWDSRVAFVLSAVLVVMTGALPPFAASYSTLVALFTIGALAALCAMVVPRRSRVWLAILILSAAGGAVLFAHAAVGREELVAVAPRMLALGANVAISLLLSLGLLYLYELFTGITTVQTLTEWADQSRPLLRRLSMEAPGTYGHSISVATLAEAASQRIGADGMLARVGAYYHDVGKALRPQYYVENQAGGHNPHDEIPPELSARIIREHVTEGERLAREAKVPRVVLPFIREHHGTQRISIFWTKAKEAAEAGSVEELDEEAFRYQGPRPSSKETAVLMCADSCESAVRAMRHPTTDRIRKLIDRVVDGKLAGGQFDEAPITLGELEAVKREFVRVLAGSLHTRGEYPETKLLTDAPDSSDDDVGVGENAGRQGKSDDDGGVGEDAGRPGESADGEEGGMGQGRR